jgi:DNA-binding PadR family transcriptional regulator
MVTEPLRPTRGGFLRPFGCGWFTREFLLGNGPVGSPTIDANIGTPQTNIFHYYKEALFRAYAEDKVALEEESRTRKGLPPFSVNEAEERTRYYLERIPSRLTGMRYSSFTKYFSHLKRLGYVEETGKEERSLVQVSYPAAPPRRYFRLTEAGKKATMADLSDPIMTLYQYSREKRSTKRKYRHSRSKY